MTQTRRAVLLTHRARPAATALHNRRPDPAEEEKIEYIEFINKLMYRMRMDSVKRMLEAALKEVG